MTLRIPFRPTLVLLVLATLVFAIAGSSASAATRGPAPYGCRSLDTGAIRTLKAGKKTCAGNERRARLYNCVNKETRARHALNQGFLCSSGEVRRTRYACRDRRRHTRPLTSGRTC